MKIRHGVYETNSSSVHVMAIPKRESIENLEIPDVLNFKLMDLRDKLHNPTDYQSKANYLYSVAFTVCIKYDGLDRLKSFLEWCDKIKAILVCHGVKAVNFQYITWTSDNIKNSSVEYRLFDVDDNINKGVDMDSEYSLDDLNIFTQNSEYLMNYLFNPKTQLIYGMEYHYPDLEIKNIDSNDYKILGTNE